MKQVPWFSSSHPARESLAGSGGDPNSVVSAEYGVRGAAATDAQASSQGGEEGCFRAPAAPVPPPPPPTPEQMPAVQPQVHYSQGQLTIVAENSTLADILRAVRAQTGAAVEVPPNATERVVTHLGPGPARDVLAALLNGSHFNYVMLGSAAHPDSVDRLILTSKSGGVPEPAPPPAATPVAEGNDEGQMDDAPPLAWISPSSPWITRPETPATTRTRTSRRTVSSR